MSKTLVIREDQLDEIEGGNYAYLDDTGSDVPKNIANNETMIQPTRGAKVPPMTDDVANHAARNDYFGFGWSNGNLGSYGRGITNEIYTKKEFVEKVLNETNNALNNINMSVTDQNGQVHIGDENSISTQETRARQRGDKETSKILQQTLKNYREPVKAQKEMRKKLGLPVNQTPGAQKPKSPFTNKGHRKNNISFFQNN